MSIDTSNIRKTKACRKCSQSYKIPNYLNKKFGKLFVVKFHEASLRWECVCDCGKTTFLKSGALTTGNSTSCGCSRKIAISKRNISNKIHKDCNELRGDYFRSLVSNARVRKIEFNLSIEECYNQFVSQNSLCNLTGDFISLVGKKQTASLDRIDSNKPYSVNNIQWVHKDVNLLKSNFDQDYFFYLCSRISKFGESDYEQTKIHLSDYDIRNLKFYSKKCKIYSAEKRGLEYSVSTDFLISLFEKESGRCKLSKLKLWFTRPSCSKQTASLDRIDSSKGYTEDNVQWIHKDINRMKMARTDSYLIYVCKLISYFRGDGYLRNNNCYLIDIDGCIFLHQKDLYDIIVNEPIILEGVKEKFRNLRENGDYVVLTTARPESMRALTLKHLNDNGLWCDQLVMGLPIGPRVVINDAKPNGMITAKAFCIERDKGLKGVNI